MANNDILKQFWAGIFSILGLGVVIGVILFIGIQKGLAEPKFPLEVIFEKVSGLSENAPVRLSGVTVGAVSRIDFLEEEVMGRGLKVTLEIYKRFERQIARSTKISIFTEGVLGAKYVEIGRVTGATPIDISKPVIGEPLLDVYDIAEVLQDTASSFNQTTHGIDAIMHELQYISLKTKRLLDRIEQRTIDGSLFKVF
ncbi:MAG: MCE family protein [Candidatus Omnitrophica bacterium]|nr:MCE family protein [Candidatus Omnitrophota bacterium]